MRIIKTISKDREYDMYDLSENLSKFGFSREDYVNEPGQFSIRGCIMEIFSFSQEYPYRIEFFGDIVESIRTFNIADQVEIEELTKCEILSDHDNFDRTKKYGVIHIDELGNLSHCLIITPNENEGKQIKGIIKLWCPDFFYDEQGNQIKSEVEENLENIIKNMSPILDNDRNDEHTLEMMCEYLNSLPKAGWGNENIKTLIKCVYCSFLVSGGIWSFGFPYLSYMLFFFPTLAIVIGLSIFFHIKIKRIKKEQYQENVDYVLEKI